MTDMPRRHHRRLPPPDEHLGTDLAAALAERSPRLFVGRPMLVPHPGSPTGWVLVVPDVAPPQPFREDVEGRIG